MKKEVDTKKKEKKPSTKQEKALLVTFILLVVLVVVLAIIALGMKNKTEEQNANIVIPILEENSRNEISVDISEMKEGETKEYIFKVTNYKDKDINEQKVKYDIDITSSDSATIKLYKNGSTKNIITENDLLVEDNALPKDKKTEDEYHLIIELTKKPSEDDKITLKIKS